MVETAVVVFVALFMVMIGALGVWAVTWLHKFFKELTKR